MRATSVQAAGTWSSEAVDSIVLDFDGRHRRRMAMTGTHGLQFVLDLPEAVALRGGDALLLENGRVVEVVSAPEPLVEIKCRDQRHLLQVAWHLGNRHLPTQIMNNSVRIRRDHVIEDMARGLGARVIEIEAPFDPEGGAYAGGGGHSHAHEHDPHETHDHAHVHAHDHGHHPHDHKHHGDSHGHVHGAGCKHDHG